MAPNTLLLSGIYPPDTGGPAKFVETFSKWRASSGGKTTVISYSDSKSITFKTENSEVFLVSRNTNIVFRYLKTVVLILKKQRRVDSIIANGLFVELSIARYLSNLTYVVKVPGDIVWERARNLGLTNSDIESFQKEDLPASLRWMRFLFTRCLRMSSAIIVPSEQLKWLVEAWGVESHKINVIHNSVDTELFHPVSSLKKDIDVLTVCRLVPWKGVSELIECAVKYRFNLTIVGDGPDRRMLEDLATELKGTVNFLGDLDQSLLPDIYARSKYFVLNSSYEATSYALLEARSSGLVCAGNSNTGSTEIINHLVDGFICQGSDGFSLSDFFEYIISADFDYLAFSNLSILDTKRRFDMKRNYKAIYELAKEIN